MKDIKKILIICLSGMGNFLMYTPALDLLRRRYPHARIDICVRWNVVKDLLQEDKRINTIHVFDEQKYKTLLQKKSFMDRLRSKKYDMSICAYPSNRWQYNALAWYIGAPLRYTHSYPESQGITLSFLQNRRIPALKDSHDVEQNIRLAEHICGIHAKPGYQVNASLPEKDLAQSRRTIKRLKWNDGRPIIAIHPSFDPNQPYKGDSGKRIEFFSKLSRRLITELRAHIIVIGGPKERDHIMELQKYIKKDAYFAIGQGIIESAGLIKSSDLLINIDSGLGHIASVVGTPSITLFGPVPPSRTRPYNKNQTIIRADLKNEPIYRYPYYSSKQSQYVNAGAWYDAISEESVMRTARRMLQTMRKNHEQD